MTVKQREIKTYENIFVSVDGREFDKEEDCKNWESSYKGTLSASWNEMKKIRVDPSVIGLPYVYEDHNCYVIKPKNLDEVVLINAYIKSTTYNEGTLTNEHIGKLVALNFGYDHDYCDVFILVDHVERVERYITELEIKITENA